MGLASRGLVAVGALLSTALAAGAGCGGSGASVGTGASTSSSSASTTGTGGTATGTGGSSAGTGGGAVAQDCQTPPCLNVINHCPFTLWIHAKPNAGAALTPDNAPLAPGAVQQYPIPASWPSARVNAYWEDPSSSSSDPNAYDKVELTVGGGKMNYNITYVDYLALPSRMEAIGASCPKTGSFDPAVSCPVAVSSVLTGCPDGLLDGKRCLSAGAFCSPSKNQASSFCHALDAPLAACEQQDPTTCGIAAQLGNGTPNVYSCSGYFDSQPPSCSPPSTTCHAQGNEWCAALNRGMLADPMSADAAQYYTTPPYNTYAKWVHETCPGIYAFPYDDYPSVAGQSGYRSCTADRLDITFCPGG